VALETARLCSTGVITTFSDFSDGKNNNTTNRNNNSNATGARNNKIKPKSSPKRKNKKKNTTAKIVKRTTSSGENTYHEEEEEKISEDDDESASYISQTTNGGGSHTIITTATTEADNALPSINEEGGVNTLQNKKGGKKFTPKKLFAPLLKNETDDHSTSLTAYQKYQEQLAREAQDLLSSGDVWMCSLCGTPFDSLESADSHELHCVVQWIRCGLIASSTGKKQKPALLDSNGQMSQQSQGRTRAVSLDSLDGESEYEDEQKRLYYMSARSRNTSSQSPFQQRSNNFRSYRSSRMPTTNTKHISALTMANSSIMSRLISFDSSEAPSPPLNLSVTPSIHLPPRSVHGDSDVRGIVGYGPMDNSSLYEPPRTGGEITLPSQDLQQYMMITDKMAVTIAHRTWKVLEGLCHRQLFNICLDRDVPALLPAVDKKSLLLLIQAFDAQRELAYASRDRHYYATVEQHSLERRYGKGWSHRDAYYYRSARLTHGDILSKNILGEKTDEDEPQSLKSKMFSPIKDRFVHAHELIKKGPTVDNTDLYHGKGRSQSDQGDKKRRDIKHTKNTLYINVVVRNSVQVVNNELERMARGWWQDNKNERGRDFQFEWIRAVTQQKVIQLAGLALASDFTPRKVAVQLSNDLYRLIGPRLEQRGVSIQTDIEYRTGPFFVIAVEVNNIDWILLMEHTANQWARQKREWIRDQRVRQSVAASEKHLGNKDTEKKTKKKRSVPEILIAIRRRYFPSRNEVIAYLLASFYQLHYFISLPILQVLYALGLKYSVDKYILRVVSDDIFRYVEKKGMEMQLEIKGRSSQATFMLAALREMREDKRKEEAEVGEDAKPIVGPLMGPAIKEDKNDVTPPPGFSLPESLEFVGLEVDLPVGFLRLRWSLLNAESNFMKDAFFVDLNYDKITMGTWSANENDIGLPKAPDGIDENSFVGATMEYSYLMPKSAFVSANMCYATWEILQYDANSLVIKEKTLTPEVPYGSTFISWTQYSILNTGKNSCRMVCSVEAEFPNGQPMVARQIKSGMRAGTAEKFVLLGETICRYADAYP